jgi:transposase
MQDVTFIPLDARKTSAWVKASGIKNDKIDAQVLCHACLHGGIGRLAVHEPDPENRECVQLSRYRDSLVRRRSSVKRQLGALERDIGPNPYTGEIPGKSTLTIFREASIRGDLEMLDRRIEEVEDQMHLVSKEDVIIPLLESIPGIGFITGFALRHAIGDIKRFEDASRLSSYFGFGVREHCSGEGVTKGKITKTGNALVRRLLIQGGQVIRFKRSELVPLYFPSLGQEHRMQNSRHANKVTVALARKHLVFAYHVWNRMTPFNLDKYRERRQTAALGNSLEVSDRSSVTTPCTSPSCVPSTAAELVSAFAR